MTCLEKRTVASAKNKTPIIELGGMVMVPVFFFSVTLNLVFHDCEN